MLARHKVDLFDGPAADASQGSSPKAMLSSQPAATDLAHLKALDEACEGTECRLRDRWRLEIVDS